MTRHPVDFLSLTFGVLFAVIGFVLMAGDRLALTWEWLAPATVIGLGAILIAAGWSRRAPDEAS